MISLKSILEATLPPGISSNDVTSIDDFVSARGNVEEAEEFDPQISKADIGTMMQKKLAGVKGDKEQPYIHASNIRDEKGNPIDPEALRKLISIRPDHILQQNTKIKKSGANTYVFYNITLPAYKGLFYDEMDKEFKIVSTCPSAGACKVFCYARKGGYVQWSASSLKSTRIVNFLMNDWQEFKSQLASEINQAYEKSKGENIKVVVRWHDSGDFLSEKYLQIAYDIAKATPKVIHYAYTKRVKMVTASNIPKNFVFNFSIGGTEDALINKEKQKHSDVVPARMFRDLGSKNQQSGKFEFNDTAAYEEFKKRMAKEYNISVDTIILYDELMKIPYDEENPNIEMKWNVIVKAGDGDDAAMRKDVLGTYLLIH